MKIMCPDCGSIDTTTLFTTIVCDHCDSLISEATDESRLVTWREMSNECKLLMIEGHLRKGNIVRLTYQFAFKDFKEIRGSNNLESRMSYIMKWELSYLSSIKAWINIGADIEVLDEDGVDIEEL